MDQCSLFYDWNEHRRRYLPTHVELDDGTLHHGMQSLSVVQPTIDEKLKLLHLMDELGIHVADIGHPGAGKRVAEQVERLAREIVDCGLRIRPACAARTLVADIQPIVEISQRAGLPIEAHVFVNSSPLRRNSEAWSLDRLLSCSREALSFAVSQGCTTMYVTEDTTRCYPGTVHTLLSAAIECGAKRVCLCDTAGLSTPNGVMALIKYVRQEIIGIERDVKIDWHSHADRGLSLANALAAVESGAHRIHGTALGIGKRSGHTPMDLLLYNLRLLGIVEHAPASLHAYCEAVAAYTGHPIPENYPVVGAGTVQRGPGLHAAMIRESYLGEEDHRMPDEVLEAPMAEGAQG